MEELPPKVKVKQLVNELKDNCVGMEDYWAKECALLCISKQLELLRYLGTKTSEQLYDDLLKQKVALKDNFN